MQKWIETITLVLHYINHQHECSQEIPGHDMLVLIFDLD